MAAGEVLRPRVVIGGSFALVDDHGRAVTDADYHGRHAVLFFGFTHCKVVCPRMLDRINAALDALGPLADGVQPLYISVDPARDTPEVMRRFLETRYPRFTGLTGDAAAIERMKSSYKVFAQKQQPDETGAYDVPHTAMIFVVGSDGNYITHFHDAAEAAEIADRLRSILVGAPKCEG